MSAELVSSGCTRLSIALRIALLFGLGAVLLLLQSYAVNDTTSLKGSSFQKNHPLVYVLPEMTVLEGMDPFPDDKDFGGLEMEKLTEERFYRSVSPIDGTILEKEKREHLEQMEESRSNESSAATQDEGFPKFCHRPRWSYDLVPVCNIFHELSYNRPRESIIQDADFKYLASGYFRETYLYEPKIKEHRRFVVKNLRYKRYFDRGDMLQVQREAVIMDKLTSSPRISNMYGHCATSIMVEAARGDIEDKVMPEVHGSSDRGIYKQYKLDRLQQHDVFPFNGLTAEEKLDYAIVIAESLADMHGYEGGVMVNDDIDAGQWLITDDGRLILNDFNNAVILPWSRKSNSYCKVYRHYESSFRGPEEMQGDDIDESADTWPFSNMLFGLLTGLKPFYDIEESEDRQKHAIAGNLPYLDPRYAERSFIEGRLVKIMSAGYKHNPDERADIFQAVDYLHETRRMYQEMQSI